MQLFKNPKNIGEIKNADGIGKVGNPVCGDVMWMYLKIDKKTEKIKDVKVKTFGCVAAIATSTQLTEMIKGRTINEAEKISKMDLAKAVGGLPKQKFHCSVLAVDALKKALEDYKKKK